MHKHTKAIVLAGVSWLLLTGSVLGADATAIMKEAFESDEDTSTIAMMDMTLRSANGSENKRVLKMEKAPDDKQLMWFIEPNDLRGTAFLQIKDGDDERMWLYMPSLKMTNRISGKRKRDSFMGSEFTYEDMSKKEVSDFEFSYVREDEIDGRKVHVIDGKQLDKDSAYSKSTFYVTADEHKDMLKTEAYGRSGELSKVTVTKEIKVIDGKRIPTHIEITSQIDGDSTILKMREIKLGQEIPSSHFSQRYLPKVR